MPTLSHLTPVWILWIICMSNSCHATSKSNVPRPTFVRKSLSFAEDGATSTSTITDNDDTVAGVNSNDNKLSLDDHDDHVSVDDHRKGNSPNDKGDDGWESVPWLDSSSTSESSAVLEASKYEEHLQVFSPSGRLHFVEAAMKASRTRAPRSNVVIALHCRDGLVAVTTVPTSAYLNTTLCDCEFNDSDSHSRSERNFNGSAPSSPPRSLFVFEGDSQMTATTVPIFDLHPCIIAATGGNAADGQLLREIMLDIGIQQAMESQDLSERECSASAIARAVADQLQKPTQTNSNENKLLASTGLILGNRDVWRIDPTGQFWKCHAAVAGADAYRVEELLYDKIDNGARTSGESEISSYLSKLSSDEAIRLACDCLMDRIRELLPPSSSQYEIEESDEPLSETPVLSSSSQKSSGPRLFWYGVVLHYGDTNTMKKRTKPKRRIHRGVLTPFASQSML